MRLSRSGNNSTTLPSSLSPQPPDPPRLSGPRDKIRAKLLPSRQASRILPAPSASSRHRPVVRAMGRRGGSPARRPHQPRRRGVAGNTAPSGPRGAAAPGVTVARGASLGRASGTGGALSPRRGRARRATAFSVRHRPSGAKATPHGRPGRLWGIAPRPPAPLAPDARTRMTQNAAVKRREARRLAWGSWFPVAPDQASGVWPGSGIPADRRERIPREPAGFGDPKSGPGGDSGARRLLASAPDGASPLAPSMRRSGDRDGQIPALTRRGNGAACVGKGAWQPARRAPTHRSRKGRAPPSHSAAG
jgi:hypothetical protein